MTHNRPESYFGFLPATRAKMKRLFGKKPRKSSRANPSPKHTSPGIPTNVAAGPLELRAEPDIDPDDERGNGGSRIEFQDNSGEDKELPAPEVLTSGVGTDLEGSDPTRENTADTGEGGGGGELVEASKVSEREYKNMVLTATTTLSGLPRGAADGFSPLGPLKAVLRTAAAVYANNQETVAIGKIESLSHV
ncbi:hypothetical protein BDM02DRAFT_986058 [Thelephora ganbajun]|uniref:Uncharacterized protein n=1 Tax=Thelephora ganbajun TaxID=370292 RepID=A0ACB6Z470_THEGA|nr:hypothetical protein BDM02DRAFT_986058 [Thelephora ganbajun]